MRYSREEHFVVESIKEGKTGSKNKVGRFFCILNGQTYKTLHGLRNAIRPFGMKVVDFYKDYYMIENENVCQTCGKTHENFRDVVIGFSKWCSAACHSRSDEHRLIISKRFIGDDEKKNRAISQLRITVAKKSDEDRKLISEKQKATITEKYGKDYLSNRVKAQWANYTEDQIKRLTEKANKTKRINGTHEYNWFACSNKRIEVGGKSYFCQGFEDIVIKFLFDFGFSAEEILNGKEVPRIPYSKNVSGFTRPDIYLPKINLLIEVKSDYTLAATQKIFESNFAKQKAAIDVGYNHIIFAIKYNPLKDSDKKIFSDFLNMTISSQAQEIEKVQRLSVDTEYRPRAIGSGSSRVPKNLERDIVCSV